MNALREWFWNRCLPFLGALAIRALRLFVRLRIEGVEHVSPFWNQKKPIIVAFWHGQLLMMPFAHAGRKITVLVSHHRDGQLIGRTVSHWGFDAAYGSSTRGGMAGFRALVHSIRDGVSVAVAPDGPRGPAGVVNPGTALLAKTTGAPIVPIAFAASKKKSSRRGTGSSCPFRFPAPCFSGVNP